MTKSIKNTLNGVLDDLKIGGDVWGLSQNVEA